ncbi:PREDICTED: uncharacterized protein LOC109159815 [Ipomoea nil]|uniref:uncharacterized protein LOC109159815 n=1 Tax=Ipomoea nil TaxID=35883 RepID=UPI000901E6D4|nr:PREDICTED: uncharacterized protein LOC109159815 [Ipomoea nil]
MVSECIGVRKANDLGKYLGLPSVLGRNKTATLRYVKEKVRERISSWQHRFLSKAGNNPSYIWRSIIAGQEVLKYGAARRLGDGKNTRIWGWGWLADSASPHLITPCNENLKEAKVHRLLNNNGQWDEEIIRDIFHEDDVRRILATPVNILAEDTWRWPGDLRGMYAVKHGYQLLTANLDDSEVTNQFHSWNKLWSLPVSPKVRNFLWRCIRGILPVKENLQTKRVWLGGGCPLCSSPSESTEHLLCDCSYARALWRDEDIRQGWRIQQFMESRIGSANTDQAAHLAAICWTLWMARNDAVWRQVTPTVEGMRKQIHRLQVLWKENYGKNDNVSRESSVPEQWEPPPYNTLKCNVDAALFTSGAGFGAVVRDHEGRFVAATCGKLQCDKDPFMAEVAAAKEALSWLKDLNPTHVILESDCLNFCIAFNSSVIDFSYVGSVVTQCRSIARDIGNVCVCHVRRSANLVAHKLARATDSMADSRSWVGIPPTCIAVLLN